MTETIENIQPYLDRLRRLDDGRMVYVIQARFGMIDEREHTLEEIGQSLGGLTRERIRQIEFRAINLLNKFASEDDNPNILTTLREMKLVAKIASKTKPRRLLPSSDYIPTMAQLSDLRRQINDGKAHLESLGISI